MYISKKIVSLAAVFSIFSCGGGGSDSPASETEVMEISPSVTNVTTESEVETGIDSPISAQCSRHANFFEQLSGERVGTITTFDRPGVPSCEFDVSLVVNNDPSLSSCQVTANISYTSIKLGDRDTISCDSTESRSFNVVPSQPVRFLDQIPLPITLLFQSIESQPLTLNGSIVEYPLMGVVDLDENFNLIVDGQFLTRP